MTSNLREIYESVPYLSIKYDTYFSAYEALLQKYVDCEVTVVEVGIQCWIVVYVAEVFWVQGKNHWN